MQYGRKQTQEARAVARTTTCSRFASKLKNKNTLTLLHKPKPAAACRLSGWNFLLMIPNCVEVLQSSGEGLLNFLNEILVLAIVEFTGKM